MNFVRQDSNVHVSALSGLPIHSECGDVLRCQVVPLLCFSSIACSGKLRIVRHWQAGAQASANQFAFSECTTDPSPNVRPSHSRAVTGDISVNLPLERAAVINVEGLRGCGTMGRRFHGTNSVAISPGHQVFVLFASRWFSLQSWCVQWSTGSAEGFSAAT